VKGVGGRGGGGVLCFFQLQVSFFFFFPFLAHHLFIHLFLFGNMNFVLDMIMPRPVELFSKPTMNELAPTVRVYYIYIVCVCVSYLYKYTNMFF
jgi:hypothetical protein